MKPFSLMLIVLFLLAPGLKGDTIEDLIQKGDELYVQRQDPAKAAQALVKYQEALKLAPENFVALIKNAQALYYVGDLSFDSSNRQRIFKQGMEIAKQMAALRPERVEGHYWLGVHSGSYGEARGVLKSLFLKNDIIRAMERAIALDDAYEHAGAHCVLGRLYYKVPGLFGGSKKKSRRHLEQCRKIAPKSSVCLLFLAETYWSLGEKELAVRTLEELLAMQPEPLWIPETEKDKIAGAKLLQKYIK